MHPTSSDENKTFVEPIDNGSDASAIDPSKSKEHWNKGAGMFGRMDIVDIDSDYLRNIIKTYKGNLKNASVLDIGCGTGIWTLGLSEKVRRIVGIDMSETMIEFANLNKEKIKAENAEFYVSRWKDLKVGEGILSEKFDIVVIHMTPALRNMDDLKKVLDVCKGNCYYTTGVRRTSNVCDKLDTLCPERAPRPRTFMYRMADLLLDLGIRPQLSYDSSVYDMEYTVEDLVNLYKDIYPELTRKQMRDALRPLSSRGVVVYHNCLEYVTLYWTMNDEKRVKKP